MNAGQTEPPVDTQVFDIAVFSLVQDVMSNTRLRDYLSAISRQLEVMKRLSTTNGSDLREQAHQIISQAGALGLVRLSRLARNLEDACIAGRGTELARRECCKAAEDIQRYAVPETMSAERSKTAGTEPD